jgi:hypothetical protein
MLWSDVPQALADTSGEWTAAFQLLAFGSAVNALAIW